MATSSTSSTNTEASSDAVARPLLEQLVQLTAAIQELAQQGSTSSRPVDDPVARARARVVLGYEGLGALMGRVPQQQGDFSIDTFEAARRRPNLVLLRGLPRRADWLEVRSGTRLEVLPIKRCRSWEDDSDEDDVELRDRYDYVAEHDPTEADDEVRRRGYGFVRLQTIGPKQAIGSLLALDRREGDLLAFGPRLAAFPPGRPAPPAPVKKSE